MCIKLNKNNVLTLFLISFLAFLGYFFNPLLAYFDSYAFLGGACGLNTGFVIPFVPCNIFLIKLLLFSCFFIGLLSISVFVKNVLQKNSGWRAGLIVLGFCPLFFQEFLKFENDVFGLTLALVGLALFSIGVNKNKHSYKALIMFFSILVVFISTFVWFATYLVLLAMFLYSIYTIVFAIIGVFPIIPQITGRFNNLTTIGQQKILEELPLIGIFGVIFFLPGLKFTPKKIWLSTALLFGAGLLQNKFMILAIPFLSVGGLLFMEKIEKFKGIPRLEYIVLILVILTSFFGFFMVHPTQQEMNLVENSIDLSKDLNVSLYNDWTYGWWVTYKGYETNYKSSYPNPNYNELSKPLVALTKTDLNCLMVFEEDQIKTYYCN